MKFTHKLSYIALGGLLMLIGMIASSVFMPNLIAQKNQFGEIECTKLTITSQKDGGERVVLATGTDDAGLIRIFDKNSIPRISMDQNVIGGGVRVFGKDGSRRVTMTAESFYGARDGGRIDIYGSGKGLAGGIGLSADELGGNINLSGYSGIANRAINLRIKEHGGQIVMFSDGEILDRHMISLGFGETNGYITVSHGEGEGSVSLSTNEYGGGSMILTDKTGGQATGFSFLDKPGARIIFIDVKDDMTTTSARVGKLETPFASVLKPF